MISLSSDTFPISVRCACVFAVVVKKKKMAAELAAIEFAVREKAGLYFYKAPFNDSSVPENDKIMYVLSLLFFFLIVNLSCYGAWPIVLSHLYAVFRSLCNTQSLRRKWLHLQW